MKSSDDPRRVRFWHVDSPSISGMLRVDREDRAKTTYSEHYSVVVVYEGAFDGWYRRKVHSHVAGAIKLKEPGEVHRDLRVHAPFTLQGAVRVAEAAQLVGFYDESQLHRHFRRVVGIPPGLYARTVARPGEGANIAQAARA